MRVILIIILTYFLICDKIIDENILNSTDCKYYTVSEFRNSINSNLNIFHNGLETKLENLQHFFSNASAKFDIIALHALSYSNDIYIIILIRFKYSIWPKRYLHMAMDKVEICLALFKEIQHVLIFIQKNGNNYAKMLVLLSYQVHQQYA